MNRLGFISLCTGLSFAVASCMSAEEKKIAAEKEGNDLVSIKSKFVEGAGEALKTDGKDAAESASEGIGEVIKGVNTGFDKSINQAKVLNDSAFAKTFEIGRTQKQYGDTTTKKRVSIYLISKAAFSGDLKLKAFGEDKKEIGRCILNVKMKNDDAKYFDFDFDKRTPLLQASYFVISIQ